jgi:hypothetical protein
MGRGFQLLFNQFEIELARPLLDTMDFGVDWETAEAPKNVGMIALPYPRHKGYLAGETCRRKILKSRLEG